MRDAPIPPKVHYQEPKSGFVDVIKAAKVRPGQPEPPLTLALKMLKTGDYVKVEPIADKGESEPLWLHVMSNDPMHRAVIGYVTTYTLQGEDHGLSLLSVVRVEYHEIFESEQAPQSKDIVRWHNAIGFILNDIAGCLDTDKVLKSDDIVPGGQALEPLCKPLIIKTLKAMKNEMELALKQS